MRKRTTSVPALALALAGSVAVSGCTHVGPRTVTVDRFDYATAIGESWKQQTLLNIVKIRYMDLPVFLDVSSIVAGYSIETSGNLGGQLSSSGAIQRDSLSLGASGKFEATSYRGQETPPQPAGLNQIGLRDSRGGSGFGISSNEPKEDKR